MDDVSLSGRIVGRAVRYVLRERLGAGGWGAVYAGVQEDLGRPVAVKALHPSVALTSEGIQRFEREAKAAAALGHPHIVQVTDFQANPGEPPFLVMELLSGDTLADLVIREGRLGPQRVAWIAHQVLSALDAAHGAGIIHRDVKPDNVFLVRAPGVTDLVKLLDFGIAKLASEGHERLTVSGAMVGSPAFMAPEQIKCTTFDHRVDLYAVGVMMYVAMAGRLPFEATSVHGLLLAITEQRAQPLHVLHPSIDPALSALVDRAMHKDAASRFASAEEMRAALQPWTSRSGAAETRAQGTMAMASPVSTTTGPSRPHESASSSPRSYVGASGGPPIGSPPPTPGRGRLSAPGLGVAAPSSALAPGPSSPYARPSHSPSHAPSHSPAFAALSGAPPPTRSSARPVVVLLAVIALLLLVLTLGGAAAFVVLARRAPEPVASAAASASARTSSNAPSSPSAYAEEARGARVISTSQPPQPPQPERPPSAPTPPSRVEPPPPTPPSPVSVTDAGAPLVARKQYAGTRWYISGGTFNEYDIARSRAAIEAVSGRITTCFLRTEFEAPDHQFTYWEFKIAPSGLVTSVGRKTDHDLHPTFDACMVAALRLVVWDSTPAGGTADVGFAARTRDNP